MFCYETPRGIILRLVLDMDWKAKSVRKSGSGRVVALCIKRISVIWRSVVAVMLQFRAAYGRRG
jgi:hypothetical protein